MKSLIFLLWGIIFTKFCFAQKNDYQDIISIKSFHDQVYQTKKNVRKVSSRPLYLKINPIYWFFYGSLKFYQKVLSAQLAKNCLHEPSCSRFSADAIREFGVIKGVALTADRLTRCTRSAAKEIPAIRVSKRHKAYDPPKLYHLKPYKNN